MAGRLNGAILAAGHGQRLRPVSGAVPKPLIELGGRPLLLRQINLLIAGGLSPIHVIVNSETHILIRQCGLRLPEKVQLLVSDTSNSMESLLELGEHVHPGIFLLMTVDAVFRSADFRIFVANATKMVASSRSQLDGVLGVVKWRGDANPLFVEITQQGIIAGLGQRQSPMVTAGIYLLSTDIFLHTAEARRRGLGAMRRFLAMLIEKGSRFAALEVPQAIDIDVGADLKAAQEIVRGEPE
jgi:choline kinase